MTGKEGSGSPADPLEAVRRIERINVAVIILLGLGSIWFKSLTISLSFLAGAALMAVNFHALKRIVGHVIGSGESGISKTRILAETILSLLFFFGGFAVIITVFHASIIAVLVGTTTLMLSLMVEGIRSVLA
ncbi:ATP synthase subunit I [Thermodesulfobacteriota bacterium]